MNNQDIFREGIWEISGAAVTGHFNTGNWVAVSGDIEYFYFTEARNPEGKICLQLHIKTKSMAEAYFMGNSFTGFSNLAFALYKFAVGYKIPCYGNIPPLWQGAVEAQLKQATQNMQPKPAMSVQQANFTQQTMQHGQVTQPQQPIRHQQTSQPQQPMQPMQPQNVVQPQQITQTQQPAQHQQNVQPHQSGQHQQNMQPHQSGQHQQNVQPQQPARAGQASQVRQSGSLSQPNKKKSKFPAIAIGVAVVFVFILILIFSRGGKPEDNMTAGGMDNPDLPQIAVKHTSEQGSYNIAKDKATKFSTNDGLNISVPAGTLKSDRVFKVYSAKLEQAPVSMGVLSKDKKRAEPAEVYKVWDIDSGEEQGFYNKEAEVTIDLSGLTADKNGKYPVVPLISIDGKRWNQVPYTVKDNKLTFKTRHFSIIAAVHPGYLVALSAVAATYMYVNRAEELPQYFNSDAPFVGLNMEKNSSIFQLYWSTSLGSDPSGFYDQEEFLNRLKELDSEYAAEMGGDKNWNDSLKKSIGDKVDFLKREYLMPGKVKEIEAALTMAQEYLEERGFKAPGIKVPVYITNKSPQSLGVLTNPWLGRRYIIISAKQSTEDIYTTALHELFHHYQVGYVWYDDNSATALMEASAMLLVREAAEAKILPVAWSDIAAIDTLRNGIEGPGGSDAKKIIEHGYGMSWFLEYLRDNSYAGNKQKFHPELLQNWAAKWRNSMSDNLLWIFKGNNDKLADAFHDFALRYMLEGMTDNTIYGKKYNTAVYPNFPEILQNFIEKSVLAVGDDGIKPWSVQFYRVVPPKESTVVVKVPAKWFESENHREVYIRLDKTGDKLYKYRDMMAQNKDSVEIKVKGNPVFLYIVDSGQTGSAELAPLQVYKVEPPLNARTKAEAVELISGDGAKTGSKLSMTWTPPQLAASNPELLSHYNIAINGNVVAQVPVRAKDGSLVTGWEGSFAAVAGELNITMTTCDSCGIKHKSTAGKVDVNKIEAAPTAKAAVTPEPASSPTPTPKVEDLPLGVSKWKGTKYCSPGEAIWHKETGTRLLKFSPNGRSFDYLHAASANVTEFSKNDGYKWKRDDTTHLTLTMASGDKLKAELDENAGTLTMIFADGYKELYVPNE